MVEVRYFVSQPGDIDVTVIDGNGNEVKAWSESATVGFNKTVWDVKVKRQPKKKKKGMPVTYEYASEGRYTLQLSQNNIKDSVTFEVK